MTCNFKLKCDLTDKSQFSKENVFIYEDESLKPVAIIKENDSLLWFVLAIVLSKIQNPRQVLLRGLLLIKREL